MIKNVAIVTLVLLGWALGTPCTSHAGAPPESGPFSDLSLRDERTNVAIPETVTSYLEEVLPGYVEVTLEDYSEIYVKNDRSWLTRNVSADFDGNSQNDFALLMKTSTGNVVLVSVHAIEESYEHYVIADDLGKSPTRFVLGVDGPGPTSVGMADAVPPRIKDLKWPGITANEMETCNSLFYYFEDGKYVKAYRGL